MKIIQQNFASLDWYICFKKSAIDKLYHLLIIRNSNNNSSHRLDYSTYQIESFFNLPVTPKFKTLLRIVVKAAAVVSEALAVALLSFKSKKCQAKL